MNDYTVSESVKIRLKWIVDVLNRFDFDSYTDQQVVELKQVLKAYESIYRDYPNILLNGLREEGIDYTDFSLNKVRAARVFVNKYDIKVEEDEKRAKI